jgi:hypothetical protein
MDGQVEAALITLGGGVAVTALGVAGSWGWLRHNVKSVEKTANEAIKKTEDLGKDVAAHREFVAREHVDRASFDRLGQRIDDRLAQMGRAFEEGVRGLTERIDRVLQTVMVQPPHE